MRKEASPDSAPNRFLIAFAGDDNIETGLWWILALLISCAYCIALLTP
jgi:hypothetical protein